MPGIRGETWWLKQEEGREREGGEDISSFSVVRSRPSSGWKTDGKSLEFSLEAALSTISFFLSFFSFLSFFLFRSLCTPPFFFHLFFFFFPSVRRTPLSHLCTLEAALSRFESDRLITIFSIFSILHFSFFILDDFLCEKYYR